MGVFLRGQIPPDVARYLARSRLVALLKGEREEDGVRPIAIGEVLHRLTSRWLSHSSMGDMRAALVPLQMGVGVSDGAAIVYRGLRGALTAHPGWCALRVDVTNAFNCVDRVGIFEGLRRRGFQRFIPFLRQFYSEPSELLYQGVESPDVLYSATGVRQGDPLGPFLFSIAFQDVLEAGAAVLSQEEGLLLSYLDDAPLAGPLPVLGRAFQAMRTAADALSLTFSLEKCVLHGVPEGA
jgi:hypothetical protein